MVEELVRAALLADHALVHVDHLVGNIPGKGHLVGHHQHGHAFLREGGHNVQHLADHLRIQCRGRLIKEQHLRVHRQRTGNGHSLLLSAGQLPGPGLDILRHTHMLQVLHGIFPGLLRAPLQHLDLSHHAVLQDIHVVEKIEGLEHHAHMRAVIRGIDMLSRHILIVEKDGTAGGCLQQVNAAQQGGLAGAGGPDDGGNVSLLHAEVDVPQHLMAAEILRQMRNANDFLILCHHCSSFSPGCL